MSSFKKFSKFLLLLIYLGMLIPSIFDTYLTFEINYYTLRLSYLFLILGLLYLLSFKTNKLNLIKKPPLFYLLFLFFCLLGLLNLFKTISLKHSFLYWAWISQTILLLPLILKEIISAQLKKVILIFLIYYGLCLSFLLWDIVHSNLSTGLEIGFINQTFFKRPHLFKEEPGYLAIFWLQASISVKLASCFFLENPKIRKTLFGFYLVGVIALFFSFSKMGMVASLFLISSEGFLFFKNKPYLKKPIFLICASFVFLASLFVTKQAFFSNRPINSKNIKGIFETRLKQLKRSMLVFKQSPILGVGSGNAKSAYEKTLSIPSFSALNQKNLHKPLAHNLYTEILSEWGLIGFFLFFSALAVMFLKIPIQTTSIQILICLLLAYLSSETIARFEVWLFLYQNYFFLNLLKHKKHLKI